MKLRAGLCSAAMAMTVATTASAEVIDLGELPTSWAAPDRPAFAVNDRGDVGGTRAQTFCWKSGGCWQENQAFLRRADGLIQTPAIAGASTVSDLNNLGEAAITAFGYEDDVIDNPSHEMGLRAVLQPSGSVLRTMFTTAHRRTTLRGTNEIGMSVGAVGPRATFLKCDSIWACGNGWSVPLTPLRAALFRRDGTATPIMQLPGGTNNEALDVNDTTQPGDPFNFLSVGWSERFQGGVGTTIKAFVTGPVLAGSISSRDLGALPGHTFSIATHLSRENDAVGTSCVRPGEGCRAVFWRDVRTATAPAEVRIALPKGSAIIESRALGIDGNTIVGMWRDATGWHAFLTLLAGGEAYPLDSPFWTPLDTANFKYREAHAVSGVGLVGVRERVGDLSRRQRGFVWMF